MKIKSYMNSVHIKIANFAVSHQCCILMDKNGDICLLKKFFDDDGRNLVRLAPVSGDYHSQENWLDMITRGDAGDWIC